MAGRPKGYKHTEESKAKMRMSHLGLKIPNVIRRPHTEAEKLKRSEFMKLWHSTHTAPCLGKKLSKEHKMKLSLASRGAKNGNWKGGLTALVKGIRRSPELYQWRKSVLERDLFTCQDCGETNNIAAHHIKSVIGFPRLIFNVDNGLTLCKDCHKIHTAWMWLRMKKKKHKKQEVKDGIH